MTRPICIQCQQRHAGINYKRNGKTYYRKKCDTCIRSSHNIKPAKPNWTKTGYKKKMICDKCHFKARWAKQIIVYYVDGLLCRREFKEYEAEQFKIYMFKLLSLC